MKKKGTALLVTLCVVIPATFVLLFHDGIVRGTISMVLERDMVFQHVVEVQSECPLEIDLSGISGHSVWSVWDVVAHRDGKEVNLQIHLVPQLLYPGSTGAYRYTIKAKGPVEEVTFGEGEVPIWKARELCDTGDTVVSPVIVIDRY